MEQAKKQLTTAEKIAEEVFRVIEREKRIVKADLVEAVEKVLRVTLPQPTYPVIPMQPHEVPWAHIDPRYWKDMLTTTGGTVRLNQRWLTNGTGDGVVGD